MIMLFKRATRSKSAAWIVLAYLPVCQASCICTRESITLPDGHEIEPGNAIADVTTRDGTLIIFDDDVIYCPTCGQQDSALVGKVAGQEVAVAIDSITRASVIPVFDGCNVWIPSVAAMIGVFVILGYYGSQ